MFQVYWSKDVTVDWMSVQNLHPEGEFHGDKSTRYRQGEIGECWLAAALESLRHECNTEFFSRVVQSELKYQFWQRGDYVELELEDDKIPIRNDEPIFMRCEGGQEYWGLLLEKAYATRYGSYEALEGGFWSDAMQHFTGGVIERIKLQERPENLFSIMLNSFNDGASLCCIKKNDCNSIERFHSCSCINIEHIEGDTSMIRVRDPYTSEVMDWTDLFPPFSWPSSAGLQAGLRDQLTMAMRMAETDPDKKQILMQYFSSYDDFVNQYFRLDICHVNLHLDNLSALFGRNIGGESWNCSEFILDEENEFSIDLPEEEADDDQPTCTFIIELVKHLKSHREEHNQNLSLEINDSMEMVRYPQEPFPFSLPSGTYDFKVIASFPGAFLRVFYKKNYKVTQR